MANGSREEVAGGILIVGIGNVIVGLVTKKKGVAWIKKVLTTVINANILITIGQTLAPVAKMNITTDLVPGVVPGIWMGIATILLFVVVALGFKKEHPITGLPIFVVMVLLFATSWIAGWIDTTAVANAPVFVTPEFFWPKFTVLSFTLLFANIATVSENFGDVQAIGLIFREKLEGKMWLSYIYDGIADILSIFGNPSTPYNESIGATQIAKNQNPSVTRNQFKYVILVTAILAISAGFMGKVTPLIRSIPAPIVGGIFWIILGIISLLGLRLFKSADVNFRDWDVLKVTIPMTLATLLGASGVLFPLPTIHTGNALIPITDFGAISVSAIVGILAEQIKVERKWKKIVVTAILSGGILVWGVLFGGATIIAAVVMLVASALAPLIYEFVISKVKDFEDRKFQVIGAIGFTLVVVLITSIPQLFTK